MPYKTDKMKLGDPSLDRRVKILPHQKEEVKTMHDSGTSIRGIARHFKVNKRLIQFILFPERQKKNLQDRKKRGGSKIYYNRQYHNRHMCEHRRYKYAILTGKESKSFIKSKIDKIKKWEESFRKHKHNEIINKKASRRQLKNWYIIANLRRATGLSSSDIKKYPQLIEAMREHMRFRRAIREKLKTAIK